MEKLATWSKSILLCYNYNDSIVKSIDETLEKFVNIGFGSKHFERGYSTEEYLFELQRLEKRSVKINLLKQIVDEVLGLITPYSANIIKDKIFNNLSYSQLADKNNISLRSAFRHYDIALQEFENSLNFAGHTEEWFNDNYGNEVFMVRFNERVKNLNEIKIVCQNSKAPCVKEKLAVIVLA
ncbi:MAG: hypothetical protein RRY78_01975 [Clostridia bacterium]